MHSSPEMHLVMRQFSVLEGFTMGFLTNPVIEVQLVQLAAHELTGEVLSVEEIIDMPTSWRPKAIINQALNDVLATAGSGDGTYFDLMRLVDNAQSFQLLVHFARLLGEAEIPEEYMPDDKLLDAIHSLSRRRIKPPQVGSGDE